MCLECGAFFTKEDFAHWYERHLHQSSFHWWLASKNWIFMNISAITFHIRFCKTEMKKQQQKIAASAFFGGLEFLSAAQLRALNKVWHNIAVKYSTLQHHLLLFAFFQLQYACEHRHQSAAKLGVMLSEWNNIFSIMVFGSEIIIPVLLCPVQWKDQHSFDWRGWTHVCNWTHYRFSALLPLF